MRNIPKRSGSTTTTKSEENDDSEDVVTSSEVISLVINDVGMEDEEPDEEPIKLEIREVKSEEKFDESLPKLCETMPTSNRSTSSFSPPPALSPAYSLQDEQKEEEDMEMYSPKKQKIQKTSENKKPGIRKVTSSPAIVQMGKPEKMKYKKKDKDTMSYVDPNAPKRNRSAYVHFIISRRSHYSKATMSQRDINIALAADWQKLPQEERKPFHAIAEEEKVTYLKLMDEYRKTDSHKEFQKKRSKFLSSQNRKRKHVSDESDDDEKKKTMTFPKTDVFCPLLNPTSSESTSSNSLQYVGPIFTPEFMAYNKTRDSYRRQLVIERSNVEHELEALHEHDPEVRIQKQVSRIRNIDEKTDEAMKTMRTILAGVPGAKEHLTDIDSLTEWLQTVIKLAPRDVQRKSVRDSLVKHSKTLKK